MFASFIWHTCTQVRALQVLLCSLLGQSTLPNLISRSLAKNHTRAERQELSPPIPCAVGLHSAAHDESTTKPSIELPLEILVGKLAILAVPRISLYNLGARWDGCQGHTASGKRRQKLCHRVCVQCAAVNAETTFGKIDRNDRWEAKL